MRALFAHHAAHSAAIARDLSNAGLTSETVDVASLAKMPVLTRSGAQALAEVPAVPVPPMQMPLYDVQSSGSSGVPVLVRKTQLSRLMWMAMTLRYHDWAQTGPYGRLATIRPDVGLGDDSPDWGAPVALFHKTGPVHRIPVDIPLEAQARRLIAFRPDSLIAYPSNLQALAGLGALGDDALSSVTLFRTLGEMLSPELRADLSKRAPVFDCYSAEEIGYGAIQCPESELYHIMSETTVIELLDDAGSPTMPGEIGRVVATDLHNYAMPIVRYDTGDYAVAGPPCPCGRGLPTLERIVGRWRGMVVKPDGSRHWPLTGIYGYRKIAKVRQYQMIQHAIDRIELRLAVDPLSDEQIAKFEALLRQRMGEGIVFEINRFDRLPPGPRGKSDEFISLVGERV